MNARKVNAIRRFAKVFQTVAPGMKTDNPRQLTHRALSNHQRFTLLAAQNRSSSPHTKAFVRLASSV